MGKTIDLYDSFPIKTAIKENNKKLVLSDSGDVRMGTNLICDVVATHSGTLINSRVYPPEGMMKGIKSWTTPYKKPVLVNHNDEADPIGRVLKAKYVKTPRALESSEYKPVLKASDGYGYVNLTVKITDSEAIQKVLDGRYETVSVRMSTDHAFCSICGADWAEEGPCDHMPGKKYEDKLAYITTGNLTYREVSFVNVPADEFAHVESDKFGTADDKGRDPVNVEVYANNAEEKFLCDMNGDDTNNLYDYLKDEYNEEEDIIVHLIDKSKIGDSKSKEDQMSNEVELTKEKLVEMDAVKELIQEATDKQATECEVQLKKVQEECKKMNEDTNSEELLKQLNESKESMNAFQEAQKALVKEKTSLEEERNQLKDELGKRETERKTLLDENVSLNSELHKLNAERLFDLKAELKKPDVSGIKTLDDRDKKVEEFAQRSIDSLKDQINDLIIERSASPAALRLSKVDNPGVVHPEDKKDTKETKESKGDTLKRLFSKK